MVALEVDVVKVSVTNVMHDSMETAVHTVQGKLGLTLVHLILNMSC